MKSNGALRFCCLVALAISLPMAGNSSLPRERAGEGRSPAGEPAHPRVTIRDTEMRHLRSSHTGWKYEIDVAFPVGYQENASRRYPVVYVLDAEYNFGCTAYIARRLIKQGDIPGILVVGIAYDTDYRNFYRLRMRDSTPQSRIHGFETGGVTPFLEFLEKELFPFVDGAYRTVKGDRTIVGHSITGFFCLYTLFQRPELFQRYIAVSPSLWFSRGTIFDLEHRYAEHHGELAAVLYLSTGREESARMVDSSARLIRLLEKRRYGKLRFSSFLAPGEHHRSLFPTAFTRGLQFVFADPGSQTRDGGMSR